MLFSEYLGLGVAPAPVFSWLSPATFVWSAAPLSHITAPLSAGVVYVLLVLGLNVYMTRVRSGRGIETKKLQAVHNLILSVGSLVMLLGSLREPNMGPVFSVDFSPTAQQCAVGTSDGYIRIVNLL